MRRKRVCFRQVRGGRNATPYAYFADLAFERFIDCDKKMRAKTLRRSLQGLVLIVFSWRKLFSIDKDTTDADSSAILVMVTRTLHFCHLFRTVGIQKSDIHLFSDPFRRTFLVLSQKDHSLGTRRAGVTSISYHLFPISFL
jgi:hypothetical protein